jgi:hypothetical protein
VDARKKHIPAPTATDAAQPKATAPTTTPAGPDQQHPAADNTKTEAATKPPPPKWSEAEIAEAKSECAAVLARIHAVAIPHEPIKEGACGAPAPIELVSIGQNPEVALSPPAIIRCDLAEALATWLDKDVQPLARQYLKAPIIKMETMSSYSCRNAYGRKTTKLSEHGLANALDIGDFITASAKTANVFKDWGTPQREILARIAAEKAAAEKKAADLAAADKAAKTNLANGKAPAATPSSPKSTTLGAAGNGLARATIIDGLPKLTVTLPGGKPSEAQTAMAASRPDRLGGPEPSPGKHGSHGKVVAALHTEDGSEPDPDAQAFLHKVHEAACQIFGTTLGPEANADHRNHFHVDMAPRKYKKICD